jgi:DegV family protein with EDD domain
MTRPAVLIVEPDSERRHELSRGLAELGYEVVPAMDVAEGLRFAEGLGPSVIIASAEQPELAELGLLERFAGSRGLQTLVLLGRPPVEEAELPQEVLLLPAEGQASASLVRRLRLVLLGREIGVEADTRLESLVGDLSLTPPLELVRSLARAEFTGRVVVDDGEISFERGRVVGATAGRVRGVKAFCRLGRRLDGVFRVWPEPVVAAGGIELPVADLVILAVEDASVGEVPHPRTRVEVHVGPRFFSLAFSERQQELLTLAQDVGTVGDLFDAFPETDGELLEDLRILEEEEVLVLSPPEAAVQVVTDSTADLPADLVRRLGIEVVPLSVSFGDTRYVDGVTLRPQRFYELLEAGEHHPATQPPDVADFAAVYRRVVPGRDVVSIHISGKLSQTLAHAETAAAEELARLPERRKNGEPVTLEVVDSGRTSFALGMLVVFAARMAERGLEARQIAARLPEMAERLHTLFVVDTLEYLARGGRIGKARAFFGGMLRIKPILSFDEGQVGPIDRVRGGRAAHPKILELLRGRLDGSRPLVVGIAHAKAPVWADRLRRLVEEAFEVREMILTEIGPVVGTHGGPGTVGVVAFQPTDEELELLAPLTAE